MDSGLGTSEVLMGQLSHPTSLSKLMGSSDGSGLWSPPETGKPREYLQGEEAQEGVWGMGGGQSAGKVLQE